MGNWRNMAACGGADSEVFFPLSGDLHAYDEARAICLGCDVRAECLQYALDTGSDYGMFGATTGFERRAMRQASIQPESVFDIRGIRHGTVAGYQKERRSGIPNCDACTLAERQRGYEYRRRMRLRRESVSA